MTKKYKLETKIASFPKLNAKTSVTILPTIRRECLEIGDDGNVVLCDKNFPVCSTAVKQVKTTVQLVDKNGMVVEKGLKIHKFMGMKDIVETTLTFPTFSSLPAKGMTFRLNKKSGGDVHTGYDADSFRLRVTVNISTCYPGLTTYVQDTMPFHVVARNITHHARQKQLRVRHAQRRLLLLAELGGRRRQPPHVVVVRRDEP